jgi:hypothetical protein
VVSLVCVRASSKSSSYKTRGDFGADVDIHTLRNLLVSLKRVVDHLVDKS